MNPKRTFFRFSKSSILSSIFLPEMSLLQCLLSLLSSFWIYFWTFSLRVPIPSLFKHLSGNAEKRSTTQQRNLHKQGFGKSLSGNVSCLTAAGLKNKEVKVLPTGIFQCQISRIWHFSIVFGMENFHLAFFSYLAFFWHCQRWARGGATGPNTPPDVQKSAPPLTNNLFTTVPPSNWLAAAGGRKKDYFCSKLPKFCRL